MGRNCLLGHQLLSLGWITRRLRDETQHFKMHRTRSCRWDHGVMLRALLRALRRAGPRAAPFVESVRPCKLPFLRLPLLRPLRLLLPPPRCPLLLSPRSLLFLPSLSLLNSWRSETSQRRETLPAKGKEKEKEKRTGLQKVIVLHLRTDPVKAKITEKEEEARKGSEKVMRLVRAKEFRLFRS